MKSPISGKEMIIGKEEREFTFRKELYNVQYHFYKCEESGEQFTSTELDEINILQIHNQYRDIHKLPFPEEIKEIRNQYRLSAKKMSEVLGFGINSYRNYENGEVPSHSNGKMIQLVKDPEKFRGLVEISAALNEKKKSEILKLLDALINEQRNEGNLNEVEKYLLNRHLPDEFSGYKKSDLRKLTAMAVFFARQMKPWKTQMNKLLFYADFLMFKRTCFAMSGVHYRAIGMGPVPDNYHSIFEYMVNQNAIDVEVTEFSNGAIGERFIPAKGRDTHLEYFNDEELVVLKEIVKRFKGVSTSEIIEICHKERAWLENSKNRNVISYKYAFDLSEI